MLSRRKVFSLVPLGLFWPVASLGGETAAVLQPGDFNYKHDKYHLLYQKVFGELGHCTCGVGECRVTNWRETELASSKGYDVIVNRKWYPLPPNVWMPRPEEVPKELRLERAHICAYQLDNEDSPTIACAIINVTQT